MNLISAILFYYLSFFLGRSFVIFTRLNNSKPLGRIKIFDSNIVIFYPILGMFFLGNFLFLVNFIFPINSNLVLTFFIFGFIFNFRDRNIKEEFYISLKYLFIHLIISVSIYSVNFQYDSGYYHLNYQNWIRTEKIVLGLANIFSPLGLSSISDFLAAAFWLDNNFLLLNQTSVIFISSLMAFLLSNLKNQKNNFLFSTSLFLILFCLLDNFGFNGGLNGFIQISGVVKPDQAYAVVFFLFCFFFIFTLDKNNISEIEILFLAILLLFSYQFRIISIYLLIPFTYYLYLNKFKFSNFIKIRLTAIGFIYIFWSLKWFLNTSCFIFPLGFTCVDTKWGSAQNAVNLTGHTRSFNNSYIFGNSIFDWLKSWLEINNNQAIVKNYFISLLIIYIIKKILFKKINHIKNLNNRKHIFYYYTVFIYLLVWILGSPNFRFLYGVILLSICIFSLNIDSYKLRLYNNNNFFNQLIIILFYISVFLIPRLDSYKSLVNNPLELSKLKTVEIVYVVDEFGWNYPLVGDQCWINIDCVPSKISINRKENSLGYTVFYSK